MITENMKDFGLVLASGLKKYKKQGFSDIAAFGLASSEALEVVDLSFDEVEEAKKLVQSDRLAELLPENGAV